MPKTVTKGPSLVYDADRVLDDMSIEDLSNLNVQFMNVRNDVRRWQQRINAIMSIKIERENVQRRLAAMNPDEREGLLQMVRAEGIPSREAVNG